MNNTFIIIVAVITFTILLNYITLYIVYYTCNNYYNCCVHLISLLNNKYSTMLYMLYTSHIFLLFLIFVDVNHYRGNY